MGCHRGCLLARPMIINGLGHQGQTCGQKTLEQKGEESHMCECGVQILYQSLFCHWDQIPDTHSLKEILTHSSVGSSPWSAPRQKSHGGGAQGRRAALIMAARKQIQGRSQGQRHILLDCVSYGLPNSGDFSGTFYT